MLISITHTGQVGHTLNMQQDQTDTRIPPDDQIGEDAPLDGAIVAGAVAGDVAVADDRVPAMPAVPAEHEAGQRPSPVLFVFLVIPLLGILTALIMIVASPRQNADQQSAPVSLVNRLAPNFELTLLDGTPVALADYRGRTLFINFWQTTCAPCVEELPAFAEFSASAGDDVSVLTVNFEETSEQVDTFLQQLGLGDDLIVALDPVSDVRRTYSVVKIPTTYIIAPDGSVRFIRYGAMDYDEMLQYAELVRTTDPSVPDA